MRGNLAALAATGIASEPTLRKWIAAEPDQAWILKRGKSGDSYEIDLSGAIAAFRAREEASAAEARKRSEAIKQFAMDLGIGGGEDSSAGLSIAERKQLLEEELIAIKLAKLRGELVDFASVSAGFADVMVRFRQSGETFAARLSKRFDLSRELITAIEQLVERDQADLAGWMASLESDFGKGSADIGSVGAVGEVNDG